MTIGAREAADLLERHGIEPRKGFGQNFVIDPNTIERIVRIAGVEPGDNVLEIGPGIGSLTTSLADAGANVIAVEVDGDLIPPLREALGDRTVNIVHADAMDVDWVELLGGADSGPWTLVANLPYNVGTPLVLDLLDLVPQITSFTVMVQREVAERFAAGPGTGDYGIPSVKVAYWGSAKMAGRVPPTVFIPRPRVESAIVRIDRADLVRSTPHEPVFRLVRQAFGQRRKMLRKSLGPMVTAEQFASAGIDPAARPETVDVDSWCRLADVVAAGVSSPEG